MAPSTAFMFVALPAPCPNVLVGVLTAMKIMSAFEKHVRKSVVNFRLGGREEISC